MVPKRFMVVAGEASGDTLAAELVTALKEEIARSGTPRDSEVQPLTATLEPRFFGAGGPLMAAAGVDLVFDMTRHSVVGLFELLGSLGHYKRLLDQFTDLALREQPDVIVLVDFSGFNRRLARAVRLRAAALGGWFHNWRPVIVQFVSPQVWASRPRRAQLMAEDIDLLLCIFPFEREWYAKNVPQMRVEFVGHPLLDRYASVQHGMPGATDSRGDGEPRVLLLPGSRPGELERHLPPIHEAATLIAQQHRVRFLMVMPSDDLAALAQRFPWPARTEIRVGGLPEALSTATIAIASTGTVTMECAFFGVPAVTLYRASWATFQVARWIVRVDHLAMPNLLAGETIYPELVQSAVTGKNLAREALALLENPARRDEIKRKLTRVIASLGGRGACGRAARAIAMVLRTGRATASYGTATPTTSP